MKSNGNASPMLSTSGSSPSSEKLKSALPPTSGGPVSQPTAVNDGRRIAVQPPSTPSAPRAQLATVTQSVVEKSAIGPLNSAKLAMER
jgi:THO complex subunit 2